MSTSSMSTGGTSARLLAILERTGLYELLPAFYRMRDAATGAPLQSLFAVIAEQLAVLEEDLEQRYDDHFIETCADWVVPYIGALVGHRSIYSLGSMALPRAAVANTIADRRRKGTAAMLQQLARDVTGWNANVVEYFGLLATTQFLNHLRRHNAGTPDIRDAAALEAIGTPFDAIPRTVDVRRIAPNRGRYNIPNIGVFAWRMRPYTVTAAPARALDAHRFFFDAFGADTQLYAAPSTVPDFSGVGDPGSVPSPMTRTSLRMQPVSHYPRDFSITIDGKEQDIAAIVAADLSDFGGGWANKPSTHVAVDPVLGRIRFPDSVSPASVVVSFNYGFSADIGAGEYDRWAGGAAPDAATEQIVEGAGALQHGLDSLGGDGVAEIEGSGRYAETPDLTIAAGKSVELRAKAHARPAIEMGGDFVITVQAGTDPAASTPVVTLDGLLITGGSISVVAGPPIALRLRHCTIVPAAGKIAVSVQAAGSTLEIDSCIVGGVRVAALASASITDSIVDSTTASGIAYAAADDGTSGGALTALNCTFVGRVLVTLMQSASDTIFFAQAPAADPSASPVKADRTQSGCVRYCYVPPGSSVPSPYRCRPAPGDSADAMQPTFVSLRYGDAGYCQLSGRCPQAVAAGAEDGAEMGAFRSLSQPQRLTNLRIRLDEYVRFGLEAGVYIAS